MPDGIVTYYSGYDEDSRLSGEHSLEKLRTRAVISRYLGEPGLRIVDVGGATGAYAFWLADLGHAVDLVDLTPAHIERAKEKDRARDRRLRSARVADACALPFGDSTYDIALLMGPLYHMQDRGLRVRAVREALRVLKPDGVLIIAAIGRYASLMDGFKCGLVDDPEFRKILDRDLVDGQHRNHTANPVYFTDAHFHSPAELRAEAEEAGGRVEKTLAVEGFGNIVPDVEKKMEERSYRDYLLAKIEATEGEELLLGVSSHLLAVVRK